MNTYLCPQAITIPHTYNGKTRQLLLLLVLLLTYFFSDAQELVFKNPAIEAGAPGTNGAVYRFSGVKAGTNPVDALVTISARSSDKVTLTDIDMVTTGHNKAFQPQVNFNGGATPDGTSDWWMEFSFVFVAGGTNTRISVDSFTLTALDIDGNGDKLNEWVSFYGQKSFSLESNSVLNVSVLNEVLNGLPVSVGRKFDGPVTNYANIDTNATSVMVTNNYKSAGTFKMRIGGHSTGANSGANRMYSFWFKSFSYNSSVQFQLPLVLFSFDATLNNKSVNLNWVTGMEKELSHFIVERSTNGTDYDQIAMVVAEGNTSVKKQYTFSDPKATGVKGVIYYRLKMVDMAGRFQNSQVRLIRMGAEETTGTGISTYPNPVSSELRITLPMKWQNQPVSFTLYNANGQVVKQVSAIQASQTETVNVNELHAGLYIVKAVSGNESAVQRIVKGK